MKKTWLILFTLLLCVVGCNNRHTIHSPDLAEIAGCWKGRQLYRFDRPFSEWTFFSLRPDSSLALSIVYEIGPRSRVWTYDTDVECHGDTVRWNEYEGILNKNKDTMRVTRAEAGGNVAMLGIWKTKPESSL